MLKLGLEIHREKFVVVAQDERATPHPPQRFAPTEFAPWVEARLREGFEVHVVYESCGFGYGLYRVAASWRALLPGHSGSWGYQVPMLVSSGVVPCLLIAATGHYARFAALSVYRWHPLSCAA
jgi:hypothetical protein